MTYVDPYKSAREAERAARALLQEAARLTAALVDGGNARH
jgi:hypothetical protein